ncbi:hypothetical protein ACEI87_10180 [Clostridioides difficile]
MGIKNSNINIYCEENKEDSDGYKKIYIHATAFYKDNKIEFYTNSMEHYIKVNFAYMKIQEIKNYMKKCFLYL